MKCDNSSIYIQPGPAYALEEEAQTGYPCQKENFGGYECKFVEPPPSAFQTECPICCRILRDPCQFTCCGTSFCQTCIQQLQPDKNFCPMCRKDKFYVVPNMGLKRSLKQLQVYCSHSGDGCDWKGEMGELDRHLNESSSELVGCNYAEIQCEFEYAGCEVRMLRKDMAGHTLERQDHHIKLLTEMLNEQNLQRLLEKLINSLQSKDKVITRQNVLLNEERVQNLTPHMQESVHRVVPINYCFTMENFEHYKRNDMEWYSDPFYTHPQGYKICVRIDANGYDIGRGTHVSLYTCFMRGDYDNKLTWPFCGKILIELRNHNSDNHHEDTICYNDSVPDYEEYARRVTLGNTTKSRGWGNPKFISHEVLKKSDSKTQYLKDNCLQFRVREVQLDTRHPRTRLSLSVLRCVIL